VRTTITGKPATGRQSYSPEQIKRDPAWEPTRSGWWCGDCSRERASEVRARAVELLKQTEPRWTLALASPEHVALDECLACETITAAQNLLLASRGGLSRGEIEALRSELTHTTSTLPQ
jgi:hypothetical protein